MIESLIIIIGFVAIAIILSTILRKQNSNFAIISAILILVMGISILPLIPDGSTGFYLSQLLQNQGQAKVIYTNDTLVFTEDVLDVKNLQVVQEYIADGYNPNSGGIIYKADDISKCTDKDKMAAKEFLEIYNEYKSKVGGKCPPMWVICGIAYNEHSAGMDEWGVLLPISAAAVNHAQYDGVNVTLKDSHIVTGDGAFELGAGEGFSPNVAGVDSPTNDSRYKFKDAMGLVINKLVNLEKTYSIIDTFNGNETSSWHVIANMYNQGQGGYLARFPIKETNADVKGEYIKTFNDIFNNEDIVIKELPSYSVDASRSLKNRSEIANYVLRRGWKLYIPHGSNSAPTLLTNNGGVSLVTSDYSEYPYTTLVGTSNGVFARSGGSGSTYSFTASSSTVADRGIKYFNEGTLGYPMQDGSNDLMMAGDPLSFFYGTSVAIMGKKLEANVLALCGISGQP